MIPPGEPRDFRALIMNSVGYFVLRVAGPNAIVLLNTHAGRMTSRSLCVGPPLWLSLCDRILCWRPMLCKADGVCILGWHDNRTAFDISPAADEPGHRSQCLPLLSC